MTDAEARDLPSIPTRKAGAWRPIVLFVLGVFAWQWRNIVYGPIWLARTYWADRNDLYVGATNGIPNQSLVQQARNYLTDVDHLDASGNVTAPEVLRPLGVHLDMAWFRHHAPDSVDFNPFISQGGKFVVSWLYYPGCQKTVWKSQRADTDWCNLRGRPCFPVCRLTVLMAPDLRLTPIKVDTIRF